MTNETIRQALHAMLDFNPKRGQRLNPGLIGPTGCGKTTMIEQVAKERGKRYVCVLLGTMQPEDVLGLPRAVGGRTITTIPDWAYYATTEPCILHFDEIDKPKSDVLSTTLTLAASRRIRDIELHPGTEIVFSGQPVPGYWAADETGAALTARIVWLAMPYAWHDLEALLGRSLSWLPTPISIEPPVLANPSPRSILWLEQFRIKHVNDNEPLVRMAAEGILPRSMIAAFMEAPSLALCSPAEGYLGLNLDELPKYLSKLAPSECAALIAPAFDVPTDAPARTSRYAWAALLTVTLAKDQDLLKEAIASLSARWKEAAEAQTPILSKDPTPEAYKDLEKWFLIGVAWSHWAVDAATKKINVQNVITDYLDAKLPAKVESNLLAAIQKLL